MRTTSGLHAEPGCALRPILVTRSPTENVRDACAMQGMKQSRFRQACRAGTYAYRWTALGYSAFQMYSNPWIMQAIVTAIMTFTRMTFRPWLL
eukprot:358951-Chlamydomonas_euryale.AAC.10